LISEVGYCVINRSNRGWRIKNRLSKSSWFKIEAGDKIIHFDTGYTGYFENQGIPLDELKEKAVIVLVSHYHKDHLQQEALDRIIKKDTIAFAPSKCANTINFNSIRLVKTGNSFNFEDIKIKCSGCV